MGWISKVLTILTLIYFVKGDLLSYCIFNGTIDHLQINNEKSPLLFKYDKKPEFHYPSDTGCIWNSHKTRRLHIACPSTRICYTQESSENCTYKHSPTYLIQTDLFSQKLIMPGEQDQLKFVSESDIIECEEPIEASMMSISNSKNKKMQIYSVGYWINDLDFLPIYRVAEFKGAIYAQTTIIASAQIRPEGTGAYEFREGLIYKGKGIDFTEIYDKDSQMIKFNQILQDDDLVNQFFESNFLVPGQLLAKDDFYYIPQQRSTFYYENSYPIWNTTNEGNWKLVSDIIRHLADSSSRDYIAIAVGLGDLQINGVKMHLGGTLTSPGRVRVPRILAKVAFDEKKHSRGIVYYVSNDPRMTKMEMDQIMLGTNTTTGYCKKLMECNKMHDEFDDATRGLTYCCSLKDSRIWDKVDVDDFTALYDD